MEILSIGDVATALGRHPRTLHQWERDGLVGPVVRLAGRRVYCADDLDRLRAIRDSRPERQRAARRRTQAPTFAA